ncbi:MAG: GNAT family N-acetyltransferase [Alphaproteobacteria bacterium]|nr:GNAT family N-acetyltransferase [Alphaproteobacteria bacterium]
MRTPVLTTERLILRAPVAEDFEAYAAMMADPHTARFIGGQMAHAAAWRSFATIVGHWQLRGFGMFSVLDRHSGAWLGRVGPWQPEDWPGQEVGWGLIAAAQGQGFAYEAAVACLDYVFDTLGWRDVIHCIAAENAPSIALATRLGSRWRGRVLLPPPLVDYHAEIYGQSAHEWRAR